MLTKIFDMAYEIDEAGNVQLEQDAGCGEVHRIELHPIHLRLLAEQVGILAPSSNIEADRTIARLHRQMRTILQRIDQLDDWIYAAHQKGHEDLNMEVTFSYATYELAKEFMDQIDSDIEAALTNTTKNGGISTGNGPENGGVAPTKAPKNGAFTVSANGSDEGDGNAEVTVPALLATKERPVTPTNAKQGALALEAARHD